MNLSPSKLKALVFYTSLLASFYFSLTQQTRLLGNLALYLLTLVIFTKPLARLFPTINLFKILLAIRREIGQASAFAAFGHVASQALPIGGQGLSSLFLSGPLRPDFSGGPQSFRFWGFWALVLMAILFLTSNDISTRLLKRNWFLLHKLIHPLYVFALLHAGLQKGHLGLIPYIATIFVLYLARFLAARGVKFLVSPPAL